MRSLGFDPGAQKGTAWACYDSEADALEVGTLRLADDGNLSEYFSLAIDLIHETRADVVGIETQYAPRLPSNVETRVNKGQALAALYSMGGSALKLAYIRGLLAGAALTCQTALAEVHPTTVKAAITGSGRASKAQVKSMVETLYGKKLGEDRADAAAVAVAAQRRGVSLPPTKPRQPSDAPEVGREPATAPQPRRMRHRGQGREVIVRGEDA